MNLTLMGLPGTGKGTQTKKVIDTYGILHISTGDMLHAAVEDETTLGLEAKSYIDESGLVPDEVTNGIIKERLAEPDTDKGFLLDGFSRILDQAKALDTILKGLNRKIDTVVDIRVKEGVLIEHLAGRFICRTCGAAYHKLSNPPKVEGTCDRCGEHRLYRRENGRPKAVKNRLAVNIESNTPILTLYKEQGLIHTIDGDHEVGTVFSDVKKIINEN